MIEAVVVNWDDLLQIGTARSADGHSYRLRYHDGQSYIASDKQPIPTLTGRHEQPAGGRLKMPVVGDPVLVQPPTSGRGSLRWGYMRSYLELVERRFGTAFL